MVLKCGYAVIFADFIHRSNFIEVRLNYFLKNGVILF